MSELDDLYKKADVDRAINVKHKAIDDHNRDIDIIEDVIKEILLAAETSYPLGDFKFVEFKDESSEKAVQYVTWEFYCWRSGNDYGPDDVTKFSLLSNGHILYSGSEHCDQYIKFNRVDRGVEDLTNYLKWEFIDGPQEENSKINRTGARGIRIEIVDFAVEQLGISKAHWLHKKKWKPESYSEKTNRLLSEILDELKKRSDI